MPGAVSALQYFVGRNGSPTGPFDAATIANQIRSGELKRDMLVWHEGMAQWAPANQIPTIAGLFPPPMPGQ